MSLSRLAPAPASGIPMFRRHVLAGVSVLALQVVLLAPATIATANHHLPEIKVDAPTPLKRVLSKPAPRPTQTRRQARRPAAPPAPKQQPVVAANTEGSGANASLGTPPIKEKYQLPQT